ncbi:MAG: hypothetical protein ACI9EW_002401 [Cellvibrionaceae bacterium]|jgi:hypothetical protein
MRIRYLLSTFALLFFVGCNSAAGPYSDSFDSVQSWATGENDQSRGLVAGGVYDFTVFTDTGIYWASAGERFADGIYEVEATAVSGPVDNGFGMVFMVDDDTGSFYLFEISADGFVWIGRCESNCQGDMEILVEGGWFESATVKQGLGETNRLRVDANSGNLTFFVNNQEVGQAFDNTFTQGNIGIAVETIGVGDVQIHFDNYSYTPIGN